MTADARVEPVSDVEGAVRADGDVGGAEEGLHVFGFGGLRLTAQGWETHPRLPKHWKRLAFKFFHRGKMESVEITNPVIE